MSAALWRCRRRSPLFATKRLVLDWPGAPFNRDPALREADSIAAISLPQLFPRTLPMSRFLLNLSIGAKLGIASGLGVLLVVTMVIVQMRANAAMRDLDVRMAGQQTIARDAVDIKASIRGMQIGIRDLRLANSTADMQKATDYVAARLKSVNQFAYDMLKLSKSAENRARIEKLRTRSDDYSKGAQQVAAVRAEAIAAAGG